MGAFFTVRKKNCNRVEPTISLFQEMGFKNHFVIESGEWQVYAFPKLIGETVNFATQGNTTIVVVGAPIYKGLDYMATIESLLSDYCEEGIDANQLYGQYNLIFCNEDGLEIICDPMNCKHVFIDSKREMLSSSMLAICQSYPEKLHINKEAVYEKLLTGMIMSPDTMFTEIQQVDNDIMKSVNALKSGIRFLCCGKEGAASVDASKDRKACAQILTEELVKYFSAMKEQGANGIDIGLSGGYDSRLVLACLIRSGMKNLHLHTHQTENDHTQDIAVAKAMSDYVGIPCNIVPSKHLNHCDNADDIVRKSVLFFDGRTSFSIGGCGETYTAEYRRKATQDTFMTLTGVGGELYRNVFCMNNSKYDWKAFLEDKIFSEAFISAVSDELYNSVCETVIHKMQIKLDADETTKVDRSLAQRIYCEIMMPNGQGCVIDAYNQVSCCVAPFLEKSIIQQGYTGIPYHESFGALEGEMINVLDHGLASIESSYGYPLNLVPLKDRVKEKVRTLISTKNWKTIAGKREKDINIQQRKVFTEGLKSDTSIINRSIAFLIELFPESDFVQLALSNESRKNVNFIAATIYMFKEKIEYGQ